MQGEGYLTEIGFCGPPAYQLADWRLQMQSLYAVLRAFDEPKDAWELWAARRNELFATHPSSPLGKQERRTFRGINLFAYNPALRFCVDIKEEKGPLQYQDIGADGSAHFQQIGTTVGLKAALGKEIAVYWMLGYGGGLYVPFRDASNGKTTASGGRILVDAIKGSDLGLTPDGKLILDFNFSYHPSAVWNTLYVTPPSPDDNRFTTEILAGERR